MANKPTFQQRFGFTPGKLALVVLLGAVFVGVLYYQFGAGPADSASAKKDRSEVKSPARTSGSRQSSQNLKSKPKLPSKSKPTVNSRSKKSSSRPAAKPVRNIKQPSLNTKALVAAVTATKVRHWPTVELESALAHDPFAMSETLKQIATVQVVPAPEREAENYTDEVATRKLAAERKLAQLKQEMASDRALKLAQARADFEAKVESEQRRIQAAIEKIQNDGIAIVMVSAHTRVVQIGSKVYEENDTFDGIRVQNIHDDGSVTLVQAEAPPTFVPPPELLGEEEVDNSELSLKDP